ncbi:MAG TPA: epimerase, partial [bacterium]|nr:epimerase [bacterium]HNT67279.1 epimerase [bacterium]
MGDKIRVGITGQAGFIGSHLYNYLGFFDTIERIPFQDEYFQDDSRLRQFAASCDAIVHLAAVNRHADPENLAEANIAAYNQRLGDLKA